MGPEARKLLARPWAWGFLDLQTALESLSSTHTPQAYRITRGRLPLRERQACVLCRAKPDQARRDRWPAGVRAPGISGTRGEAGSHSRHDEDVPADVGERAITLWVYVNTAKEVGYVDHLKVFATEEAAENNPEGVAFEYRYSSNAYPASIYAII